MKNKYSVKNQGPQGCHAIRNTILFFVAESQTWTVHLFEQWADQWSRSVCCLAICKANHLVTVIVTHTKLLLCFPFCSHAQLYAITCCTRSNEYCYHSVTKPVIKCAGRLVRLKFSSWWRPRYYLVSCPLREITNKSHINLSVRARTPSFDFKYKLYVLAVMQLIWRKHYT